MVAVEEEAGKFPKLINYNLSSVSWRKFSIWGPHIHTEVRDMPSLTRVEKVEKGSAQS
jgi:hypothetical protein